MGEFLFPDEEGSQTQWWEDFSPASLDSFAERADEACNAQPQIADA